MEMITNVEVPYKAESFLTTRTTISFFQGPCPALVAVENRIVGLIVHDLLGVSSLTKRLLAS
jgi:hypothetical protein